MDYFNYHNDELFAEDTALKDIAQKHGRWKYAADNDWKADWGETL